MSTELLRIALLGVVPPALVAALILAVAWRPWRRHGKPGDGSERALDGAWGTPLALGLGYATVDVVLHGWPAFPFVGIKQGLFYTGLGGAAVGAIGTCCLRGGRGWLLRAVFLVGLPWVLLGFKRKYDWQGADGLIFCGGIGVAFLAAASLFAWRARRADAFVVAVGFSMTAGLTAGALHLSGSASLGQLCGGLASALGACVLLALTTRAFHWSPGAFTPLVACLGGLLLAGRFASELPTDALLALVAASLLAGWLPSLDALRERRLRSLVLVLLAVGLPGGWALWSSYHAIPANPYL